MDDDDKDDDRAGPSVHAASTIILIRSAISPAETFTRNDARQPSTCVKSLWPDQWLGLIQTDAHWFDSINLDVPNSSQ